MSQRASKGSPTKSQATILAFFSTPASSSLRDSTQPWSSSGSKHKRNASPIDLTGDDELESHVAKKLKGSTTSRFFSPATQPSLALFHNSQSTPAAAAETTTAQQWRFGNGVTSQLPSQALFSTEASEKIRRHEAFKKTLLGESNPFARRKALEDANSVEELFRLEFDVAHGQVPSDEELDPEPEMAAPSPVKKGRGKKKAPGPKPDEDEDEDSDPGFKNMLSGFSAKGKGKTKAVVRPPATKKTEALGPAGVPWTPLELQVVEIRKANPETVLLFEVGYKYYLYEDDAKVAAKEFGFVAYPKRNLLVSTMPVQRGDVYLRKLLSRGHKVGFVNQTETAALKKVGDNRNTLFTRSLTRLYTATTYVDQLDSADDSEEFTVPSLVCIIEQEPMQAKSKEDGVHVGWVSVSPSTGEVVWDEFEDGHMRTELETRLVHSSPSELLLPIGEMSKPSEKMLIHFVQGSTTTERKTRIERFRKQLTYDEAFTYLTQFYSRSTCTNEHLDSDDTSPDPATANGSNGKALATITGFPRPVVVALAHAIKYLSTFSIEHSLLQTRFFSKFSERTHMLLNANTLVNLEIYSNSDNGDAKGSLIWILDKTTTKFGGRMLKSWVGRPLVDKRALQERVDAVEEIRSTESDKLPKLRLILKGLPDLAKGLARIQYGKATPAELATFMKAFNKIATAFPSFNSREDVGFQSPLLNSIIHYLPTLRFTVQHLIGQIDLGKATTGNKADMWTDIDKYPGIEEAMSLRNVTEAELNDQLRAIRKLLGRPGLLYTTVLKDEYLLEIKKGEDKLVPPDWVVVYSTKSVRRYQPPQVKEKVKERAQHMETLQAEANQAYIGFLAQMTENHYAELRDAINKLAVADCLLSLALVAQTGYVKPEFSDENVFEVVEGRHPMLEELHSDPFVPNDCHMGAGQPSSKIITGPNMGGKSSCVRMLALCAIMAQIGSYVPATSMRLSMLDGILTRMGAFDELAKGRSTFMVEMTETSDILRSATSKSLVILDELGRGTSTFDGMAIADAVLHYLIDTVKCKTLFITHYPVVAIDIEKKFPQDVQNLHMGFSEYKRVDGTREITFLYRLTPGIASGSFGVECGRLAALPESILEKAAAQAAIMQAMVKARHRKAKLRKSLAIMRPILLQSSETAQIQMEELRECIESIKDEHSYDTTMDF